MNNPYDRLSSSSHTRNFIWVFAVFTAIFFLIDLSASQGLMTWAHLWLDGIFGEDSVNIYGGRIFLAIMLSLMITLNLWILRKLPQQIQLGLTWLELLILFLAFFASFNLSYEFIWKKLSFLVGGAWTTIYVSIVAIIFSSILAIITAVAKLSNNGFAVGVSSFYVSFFRGLPLLMQLYLIYIGLPQLGFVIDPTLSGIVALSLCYGAYMAEIYRAGILGVSGGQNEAGWSLGLSRFQTFRAVIFPQAMKLIIPPTGNQFIAMLKDSSLVSVVGIWDLTYRARTAGRAEFRHLEMLITAALIYWLMTIVLEILQAKLEEAYKKGDKR